MNRLHSYAHVNEACYHAIRHALFPAGLPARARDGRFVSPRKATTKALRSELAASNNMSLEQAIESIRSIDKQAIAGEGR